MTFPHFERCSILKKGRVVMTTNTTAALEEFLRRAEDDPNTPTVKEVQAHHPQILEAIEEFRRKEKRD